MSYGCLQDIFTFLFRILVSAGPGLIRCKSVDSSWSTRPESKLPSDGMPLSPSTAHALGEPKKRYAQIFASSIFCKQGTEIVNVCCQSFHLKIILRNNLICDQSKTTVSSRHLHDHLAANMVP